MSMRENAHSPFCKIPQIRVCSCKIMAGGTAMPGTAMAVPPLFCFVCV